MERIEEIIARKVEMGKLYNEGLKGISEFQLPADFDHVTNTYWLYTIVLNDNCELDRDALIGKLQQNGIEGICLPSYLSLQPSEIEFICGVLKKQVSLVKL